jgi:hypothetical protein
MAAPNPQLSVDKNRHTLMISRTSVVSTLVVSICTVLLSACAGATSTATPAFAVPTSRPTQIRPTPYAGPTVTASGPLLRTERDAVRTRFAVTMPKTLGGLSVITIKQTYDSPINLPFRNTDGTIYIVELSFHRSQQTAFIGLQGIDKLMPGGQKVDIGDEAVVSAQGKWLLAAMRYRNASVTIHVPEERHYPPNATPVPLTNAQLIAVLKDVYEQILSR